MNQDNKSMECSPAEESSVASNADESTEPRSKTPRTEQTEQALSSPVTDVDKRTEVINIDDEDHPQRVKKPDQNNSMNQANSSNNTTDVSMTAAKPSTSAEQSTQPNQYNHQEHIPNRSLLSNFQPQIENVRSLAKVDDHKQLVNEVPSQKLSTFTKMERNLAIAAQNPSNSIDQTRHLSTRSVEQPPVVTQNQSQHDPRVLRTYTGNSRDQTAPLKSIGMNSQEIHRTRTNLEISTDLAAVDPRNVLQSVNNAAATSQQLLSSSHNPPSYIRPPPHIMTKVLNSMRQILSTHHNEFLLNNRHLQARMSQRSTGDNNVDLTTSPQNIIVSETSDGQNTERPSRPIYQPLRIQHTTAHENRYQNLYTQEQLVNQSTQTNSKTKRGHFMDDATRSSVTGSHRNVMDNACQPDECMVDETLSPYHAVTSDSDAVSDKEVISDHEMSTDEAPAETTNDVYGTANDPGHGSADRPTAAENYTTDMYNTLRSSILDTAETYNRLLGSVEQFNTATNAASNASPSINLRPESSRSPEERH